MNADRPGISENDEYREIRDNIWQAMPYWSKFIVTIDGRDNSGKSSLGRYLSWQLRMTCLELDTFRILELSPYDFRLEDLRRSINSRLNRNRPVIVEGVTVRKVLANLGYFPNFSVFIEFTSGRQPDISQELDDYFKEYKPSENADYRFNRGYESDDA